MSVEVLEDTEQIIMLKQAIIFLFKNIFLKKNLGKGKWLANVHWVHKESIRMKNQTS